MSEAVARAATHYRDGEAVGFERVAGFSTPDLAYMLEIERFRSKLSGANEITELALRVTTVLRHEDDGWKILHRHADPITAAPAL